MAGNVDEGVTPPFLRPVILVCFYHEFDNFLTGLKRHDNLVVVEINLMSPHVPSM